MLRTAPRATLFPYTTLFRSERFRDLPGIRTLVDVRALEMHRDRVYLPRPGGEGGQEARVKAPREQQGERRSEEHTSELQSQSNLVCRLLLEKKKRYTLSSPP